ncbi:tyrosine-type recombinase/integrase [Burkholderia cepacia]|uniref:tyrosine-type recombinase/integrase n=1 Tax=Burkholderia cepacia TaxID=292 RepID=UPI001CF5B746|nr:site-specific integrase [Burkholderia cepacia]MCA8111097.1 site-specific integrase [Burkholderia cepacia]MCA8397342.1 site-specific integrase [Burkholderia cepacia]
MAKENIRSKTARAKLRHQNEPHWDALRRGLHVGYRTSATGAGTWVGRLYLDKRYHHTTLEGQLEFDDARKLIETWADNVITGEHERQSDPDKPVTVEDACRAYVEVLRRRADRGERSAYDASNRFERLVYGKPFGRIKLTSLKEKDVTKWKENQVTGKADERKAMDSANRNLKSLKAALNATKLLNVRNELSDVKYYRKVEQRRQGWLNAEQRNKLLAAMPNDLQIFTSALLLIGARPGELAKANVADYNPNSGELLLSGKTGPRTISVSDKARAIFDGLAKDRAGNAPLFLTDSLKRWKVDTWHSRFVNARAIAGIPDAVLYFTRHTFISEAIAQGIPLLNVARYTGTSVKMIEKNYGHLTEIGRDRINSVAIL